MILDTLFENIDIALLIAIGAIILLMLLSAFFSAAETGLTAASRPRIHHLAQRGNRRAQMVDKLRDDPEELIGAILLGSNLVNNLSVALATSALTAIFGNAGVAYATGVMTALVFIFAEVLPKTYAINHPDRVALAAAPIIKLIYTVLSPALRAVQVFVRLSLRLLGARAGDEHSHITAAEEIRSSIDMHVEEGGMVKHERDMLGSILDLSNVAVSEVMVHRKNIEMIDAGQPPSAIIQQAISSRHTRLPLWRDDADNIVGVLHAKDLLRLLTQLEFAVDKLDTAKLTTEPWFIPETTTLREQLAAFRQRRSHFALVVDEYGSLMGLVTLEDILEEIVGDIRDEHDTPLTGIRIQPDGSYIVDGTVTIRDLNRQFDWHLPDDEATTIAGLVIHEAKVIPDSGQVFVFHGFKFDVLRRQRNQITTLRIRPLDAAGYRSGASAPTA